MEVESPLRFSLLDVFLDVATAEPDAPALAVNGEVFTYGALLDKAVAVRDQAAADPGTYEPRHQAAPWIAVLARDVPGLLAAELAAMSLGADVLLVDTRTPANRLAESILAAGSPPLISCEPVDGLHGVTPAESRRPRLRARPGDLPSPRSGGRTGYQSLRAGGRPVVLPREALLDDAAEFLRMTEFPAVGTWFSCLPPQSVNTQQTVAAMWLGGNCFATAGFAADRFWSDVAQAQAHATTVLGSMGQSLLRGGQRAPKCTRAALGGSFVRDPSAEFEEVTGVRLLNTFGTPLVGLVAANTMGERREGSVGRPVPTATVEVADNTSEVPGRLEVAKPSRSVGYLDSDQSILPLGATGDGYVQLVEHGHFDDDGFLFVTAWPGLLRRSGESIAHAAILSRLNTPPGVLSFAIVPDGSDGEWQRYRLGATVATGSGWTVTTLESFCRTRLPRLMQPDAIDVTATAN
jgi:acyl-CoA synthetase (AMP-forming)/AMP-acid ligase II